MVRSPVYRGPPPSRNSGRPQRGSPPFSRGPNRRSASPNRRRPLSRNGNNNGSGENSRRHRSPRHGGNGRPNNGGNGRPNNGGNGRPNNGGGNSHHPRHQDNSRPPVASMRMRMDDYAPPKNRRNEQGNIIPPLMEQTVARARREASTRTKDTFWTKKLLDAEDHYSKRGDRWAHSGFKELYRDELGYPDQEIPGPSSDKPLGGGGPKDPRRGSPRPRDPRGKPRRSSDRPRDPRTAADQPRDPRRQKERKSRSYSRGRRAGKRRRSGSRSYSSGSSSSSGSYSRSSYSHSSSGSSSYSSSSSSRSRSHRRSYNKRKRSHSESGSYSSSVTPPPRNRMMKQPVRGPALKDKKPIGGPTPPSIQESSSRPPPVPSKSQRVKKIRPKADERKNRGPPPHLSATPHLSAPPDLSQPPPPIPPLHHHAPPPPTSSSTSDHQLQNNGNPKKQHKKEQQHQGSSATSNPPVNRPSITSFSSPPPPPSSPPHPPPVHSSSDSSSSEEETPRKMTLSERFGKLAQLSSQRQEYDGVRMKIVREGGQDKKVYLEAGLGSRSPSPLHPGHERWLAEHQAEYAEYQQRYGDVRSWDPHRDLPRDLPPNWEEVGVRYRYYKQSGYFGDRHISLDDYLKWEEWWYQYRDWLKKYGGGKDGGRGGDWGGDRGGDADRGGAYSSRWPPQDSSREGGMDRKRRRF